MVKTYKNVINQHLSIISGIPSDSGFLVFFVNYKIFIWILSVNHRQEIIIQNNKFHYGSLD